jgi:hypothetical protein
MNPILLNHFSLTPGFSPVKEGKSIRKTVSTVLPGMEKAVETAGSPFALSTGLKPGVNETHSSTCFSK